MSKKRNIRKQSVRKTKTRRINKKKLIFVICIFIALIFGISKVAASTSKLIGNIKEAKAQEIQKQKEIENSKQFDLESESSTPIEAKHTVVIDPGHGGDDTGNVGIKAPGENEAVYEKDLALDISKKIAAVLSNQNDIQVILTRTDDKTLNTSDRAILANSQNADAFISIQMNAETGGNTANGVETYYRQDADPSDKSKLLAETIQNTMKAYVTMKDRGVKQQHIQVLQQTYMPSVVVECGFISNKEERDKLLDNTYQNRLSEGIAQGILSFLDKNGKK